MARWLVIIILVVTVGLALGIVLTRAEVLATPGQPIAYSHKVHIEAGLQCLFCHSSALRSDVAGVPSVRLCMGCHSVIATDNQEVQKVADYWDRGEPIEWKRVNIQPDFVYFSHQAHLSTGQNCEACHGQVGEMTTARPTVKMDMGWCLECHLRQPAEKVARITDCIACHK